VANVELGQVFSKYFRFPCQSYQRLLSTHHHTSSGAGALAQTVAEVPRELREITIHHPVPVPVH
jgi:hypothetical protein